MSEAPAGRMSRRVVAWAAAAALAWAACERPGHGGPGGMRLDDVVAWDDSVALEESAEVVNVLPYVEVERGGFLVLDRKESQGRIYETDGTVRRVFGRTGRGPGEFRNPIDARRLPDGRIAVIEFEGRLSVLDSATGQVRATANTGLLPVYGMRVLDGDELLVQGRRAGQYDGPHLHVWSLSGDSIIRGFFGPHDAERHDPRVIPLAWTGVDVFHDTVAAVWALSDTLYLFDRAGTPLRTVPIPFAGFAGLRGMPASNADLMTWLGTIWRVTDVFVLPGGIVLVQAERAVARDVRHRLLGMTIGGELLFDLTDTPRLLTAAGDTLYFVSPGSETPNRWHRGHLRPAYRP